METSEEYMTNIELSAFKWHTDLIVEEAFEQRSLYQRAFIQNQQQKIYDKLQKKLFNFE